MALLEGLERRALGFFVERRSARPARMPTRLQLHVLHGVRESGGMALGELTGYLRVGPAAASQLAQTLVARGWLGRAPDPRDRRRRVFSVTAAGSRVMAAMDRRHRLAVRRVLALLSDEERSHLRAMAEHLYGLMAPGDRVRPARAATLAREAAAARSIGKGGAKPCP